MNIISFQLTRGGGEDLGLQVAGGSDSPLQYVYICGLVPQSPAALCGRFRPGDQLVMCGEDCVMGMTCKEAREVLRCAPSTVEVVVQRKKLTTSTQLTNIIPAPATLREGHLDSSASEEKGNNTTIIAITDSLILMPSTCSLELRPVVLLTLL